MTHRYGKKRKKLSRHKKFAARGRRRKHAVRSQVNWNSTVYSAAAWWRNSEPFVHVIGTTEKVVQDKIDEYVKDEAERAYDDESYDSVDDAADDIAWSGVHRDKLESVTSPGEIDEAVRELRKYKYYVPESP